MRQSEIGAVLPRFSSSARSTTNVSGGKLSNERQFDAALYVRPVNAATEAMPPSSSMTADVVCSTSMDEAYSPNNLGNQVPKSCGLEHSPNYFYNRAMPRPVSRMPEPGTQAERARLIRLAMGYKTQKAFAARYGFTGNQWNNYERGSPISRIAAQSLARQIPGLSVGWVLSGETGDLSLDMARKLGLRPSGGV